MNAQAQQTELNERLAACGLTPKQLSIVADVSYSTARRWLLPKGEIQVTRKMLKRLRKANPAAAMEIVRDLLDDPAYVFPEPASAAPVKHVLDETIDVVETAADALGVVRQATRERSPGGNRIAPCERARIGELLGMAEAEVHQARAALQLA